MDCGIGVIILVVDRGPDGPEVWRSLLKCKPSDSESVLQEYQQEKGQMK